VLNRKNRGFGVNKVMQKNAQPWALFIIATLIGGFLFLQPFLSILALALLAAYIFNPVYKFLGKKMKSGLAVTLTVFTATFAVIIPLAIIMLLAFSQLGNLLDAVNSDTFTLEGRSIEDVSVSISDRINDFGENTLGINEIVSTTQVTDFAGDLAPRVIDTAINLATGLVSGVPSFFAALIIFLFLFTGALSHQKSLVATVKALSPFDDKLNEKYFTKIGAMAKAMLKGQMIIAIIQGCIGAASLLFLGLGDYVLLFAVVFSFLNLIPLGSGFITIPLGIFAILTGNIGAGLVVLLTHFVIVTNVDNLLRPMLVPDEAYLPASLLILATFAGVAAFGLLGVIYGPIIMIFITTTIEAFVAQKELTKKATK